MTDRGVSDVVGFILIFALITFSVGLVYVNGLSGLQSARDVEHTNNAGRAFDVLADNVHDLTAGEAPSRATEIKLADATLELDDPVTVNVSGQRVGDPNWNFSYDRHVRPIVYESSTGARVIYTAGTLLREDDSGSYATVHHDPAMLVSSESAVVPIVFVHSQEKQSVSGSKTVLIRTDRTDSKLLVGNATGTYHLWFNVTTGSTARAAAWNRSLTRRGFTCTATGATASCQVTTGRLYVTEIQIDAEIE